MSANLGPMFPAMFDGSCVACGGSFDEGDLVGHVDGDLCCDACWNEAELEQTRDTMRLAGVEPGPLPGGLESPRLAAPAIDPALQAIIDAAAAKLATPEPPVMNTNPVAMKMDPELARLIENTQAIVAAQTAPLIQLPPEPAAPVLDPSLQAIIDAAKAQLAAEATPEAAVDPPVDSTEPNLLGSIVESIVEDQRAEQQAQHLLDALGHELPGAKLEDVLDLLAPYTGPAGDDAVEAFIEQVKDFLVASINNQERTLQKMIGPSEIGTECEHCLAAKLAQWQERREAAWLPTVGSAVHDWLERKVKAAMAKVIPQHRGWLAEVKVYCGSINGEDVWGTVDLVDLIRGILLDWKIVGKTTLDTIAKTDEPSMVYRIQRQIYMHGLNMAGIRVTHAVNAYLPRNAPNVVKESVWPYEAYDPAMAEAAIERADTLARQLARIEDQNGVEARDSYISLLPRQRDKDGKISCYSCPRYDDFDPVAEMAPVDHTFGGLVA